MSCLVFAPESDVSTPEGCELVLEKLVSRLRGRVSGAFVFGSAASGQTSRDSDIDLILIVDGVETEFFWHRPLRFIDLHDVFPKLDILVYSPGELEHQLLDSDVGFWKSVRQSMRRLL